MKKKLDEDIELKDPKLVGLKINPDMIEERHGQTFSAYSWFYHRKLFVNGIEVDEETQYRHPLYKDVQRWAVIKVNK